MDFEVFRVYLPRPAIATRASRMVMMVCFIFISLFFVAKLQKRHEKALSIVQKSGAEGENLKLFIVVLFFFDRK